MGIEAVKGLFVRDSNILDVEPSEPRFDKKLAKRHVVRNRGSVRLSQGLFRTSGEWQERRAQLLKKRLP